MDYGERKTGIRLEGLIASTYITGVSRRAANSASCSCKLFDENSRHGLFIIQTESESVPSVMSRTNCVVFSKDALHLLLSKKEPLSWIHHNSRHPSPSTGMRNARSVPFFVIKFRGAVFGASLMKKMKGGAAGFDLKNTDMMKMIGGFSVKRILSMMGTIGAETMSKKEILELNRKLNKIKKK